MLLIQMITKEMYRTITILKQMKGKQPTIEKCPCHLHRRRRQMMMMIIAKMDGVMMMMIGAIMMTQIQIHLKQTPRPKIRKVTMFLPMS